MYYEAHYWVRTKNTEVVYLGEMAGPVPMNDPYIENLEPLIDNLITHYGHFLGLNPQFEPEENAIITPNIARSNDGTIVINLFLSANMPEMYVSYIGKNPESAKIKMKVEAHCWELYRPAHIMDIVTNSVLMFNKFKNKEKIFPDNTLLRFMMYMDDYYHNPYIYGYFRPLDQIVFSKEKLSKVRPNEYLIEFCNTYQGYYLAIDKNKYHSNDNITEDDLRLI
jgi:hypothetical protein